MSATTDTKLHTLGVPFAIIVNNAVFITKLYSDLEFICSNYCNITIDLIKWIDLTKDSFSNKKQNEMLVIVNI